MKRSDAGRCVSLFAWFAFAAPAMGEPVSGTSTTGEPIAAASTAQVRSLAGTCTACHGTDGRAVPGEAIVALAGYPKAALIAQMQAFRDGTRSATVMHQIARGYTDRQVETLATYFGSRPATLR